MAMKHEKLVALVMSDLWETGDGTVMHIYEMTNEHLRDAMEKVKRDVPPEHAKTVVDRFNKELRRRVGPQVSLMKNLKLEKDGTDTEVVHMYVEQTTVADVGNYVYAGTMHLDTVADFFSHEVCSEVDAHDQAWIQFYATHVPA